MNLLIKKNFFFIIIIIPEVKSFNKQKIYLIKKRKISKYLKLIFYY
jgi:hypothetical protein